MADGAPRYVTAVSKSDTIDGWRDRQFDGGIVVDVQSGKIVIGGLSMPHSPRVHAGRLWVLNSGSGEIGWIEPAVKAADAKFHVVAFCPGAVRGLAFHGKFAFVGLSKPRYERFEGLALDKRLAETDSEPWCGVQVVDLDTGACVHWFRIDGPVGRALRYRRGAGRDAADVAELRLERDFGPNHPRSAQRRLTLPRPRIAGLARGAFACHHSVTKACAGGCVRSLPVRLITAKGGDHGPSAGPASPQRPLHRTGWPLSQWKNHAS
jgi:Domain of unknown function (DUF4915)